MISREELIRLYGRKKRPKYRNIKCSAGGENFDSRKEARRFQELKLCEKAGDIRDLKVHPRFVLLDGFVDGAGEYHRPITYVADYQYFDVKEGVTVVEDVKALNRKTGKLILTEAFKIKRKLLLNVLPDGTVFRVVC